MIGVMMRGDCLWCDDRWSMTTQVLLPYVVVCKEAGQTIGQFHWQEQVLVNGLVRQKIETVTS